MSGTVVVFDLGGVLYDFAVDEDAHARLFATASGGVIDRTKRRLRFRPLFVRFETGGLSPSEFAGTVVRDLDLVLDPTAFLAAFRAMAAGWYPGALALVRETAARHTVVSLSNTNAVHWDKILGDLDGADPFHAHFPSHLSGHHKPDQGGFLTIAQAYPGRNLVFLDDRTENVATASDLGWTARTVRGVDQARLALRGIDGL
ncbi:hypothetical protein LBMAG53_32610 [Planctomycetota bacterium]|nr:hypothetical protein LBMAG53_32610 [Planctomycetota bacterium]